MEFQDSSEEIKSLTYAFVKALIESTGRELTVSVKFVDNYNDACRTRFGNNNKLETNSELRHHVRNDLLKSGHILVDPKDVDSVFLTQKAIDEFADY